MTSGPVPARFETSVRVRFDEAGADGLVRTSTFLRWFQDVAWMHSEGAGFGRDWYQQRSLTWLIRSTELEVLGGVEYGTSVLVSTEVVGFRRVWARRLNEVRQLDGGPAIASTTIDWVLLGPSGVPARVPPEIVAAFPVTLPAFSPLRVTLPPTPPGAARDAFSVTPRDLDPLVHMNNAAYVDYFEDAVERSGGEDSTRQVPRRYRLEYTLPAEPRARLMGEVWQADQAWSYRVQSAASVDLFRGVLEAAGPSTS